MTRLTAIPDALVLAATAGDRGAIEDLVRQLQGPIYAVASRMLHDRADADDATQEALIRIVTRLAQYRAEARFTTWALRIAVHRILDFREQRATRPLLTFQQLDEDLADGLDVAAEERLEDAVLHRQIKLVCTRAMLQCLDGDHRVAFILGEILELSAAEAAEVVGIEHATFRKRLSRARSELTAFLTRTCGVFDPSAPCACHRRLERARVLGRVDPAEVDVDRADLVALRAELTKIVELQRITRYFQADPELRTRRDFVAEIRTALTRKETP
jgi:RNA polymerase sigma factor (sigma-70 family)